jgi:hypothetical protein
MSEERTVDITACERCGDPRVDHGIVIADRVVYTCEEG